MAFGAVLPACRTPWKPQVSIVITITTSGARSASAEGSNPQKRSGFGLSMVYIDRVAGCPCLEEGFLPYAECLSLDCGLFRCLACEANPPWVQRPRWTARSDFEMTSQDGRQSADLMSRRRSCFCRTPRLVVCGQFHSTAPVFFSGRFWEPLLLTGTLRKVV